jgi:hypothetical protein
MNNLNNNNNQLIRNKPKIPYTRDLVEDDKNHEVSIFRVHHFQSRIALTLLYYLMYTTSTQLLRKIPWKALSKVRTYSTGSDGDGDPTFLFYVYALQEINSFGVERTCSFLSAGVLGWESSFMPYDSVVYRHVDRSARKMWLVVTY